MAQRSQNWISRTALTEGAILTLVRARPRPVLGLLGGVHGDEGEGVQVEDVLFAFARLEEERE